MNYEICLNDSLESKCQAEKVKKIEVGLIMIKWFWYHVLSMFLKIWMVIPGNVYKETISTMAVVQYNLKQ